MFNEKDLVFHMPKENNEDYLGEVLDYESAFLKLLKEDLNPVAMAYAVYTSRIKAGAPLTEIEGMAQVIRHIESLSPVEKSSFLHTIPQNNYRNPNETVFHYEDGSIQAKDIKGTLVGPDYENQTGSKLIGISIGRDVEAIGMYAFADCLELTSVSIPDTIKTIWSSAFLNCSSLNSVVIPDSVTTIGHSAFEGCTALTSIKIPQKVTTISTRMFIGCNALVTVELSKKTVNIQKEAFCDCSSLANICIPKTVKKIGLGAFWDCTSLTSIVVPDSVKMISDGAFLGVPHIEYHGNAKGAPWGAQAVN